MTDGDPWHGWHLVLGGDSDRRPLLELIAATGTDWFWLDVPGELPTLEVGLWGVSPVDPPPWIETGLRAGLVRAARPRPLPLVFEPALFPGGSRPSVWGALLAVTSARAVRILAATHRNGTGPGATVGVELAVLYGWLVPAARRAAAAAWHLEWLRAAVGEAMGPEGTPSAEVALPADLPVVPARLCANLRAWSPGSSERWSDVDPRVQVIARLCHIQAVRLAGEEAGLRQEPAALRAIRDAAAPIP